MRACAEGMRACDSELSFCWSSSDRTFDRAFDRTFIRTFDREFDRAFDGACLRRVLVLAHRLVHVLHVALQQRRHRRARIRDHVEVPHL